jgi:hypothetical protein
MPPGSQSRTAGWQKSRAVFRSGAASTGWRRATARAAAGHHQGFSKVTELNDDSLFKKPWKLAPKVGLFASTFCAKRRGRDSFGTVLYGLGISAISDAMSMPVNDL